MTNKASEGVLEPNRTSETAPTRPVKHSFSIAGHRTSISLEAAFWSALRRIASVEQRSIAELVRSIDETRGEAGLSGAIRVWILNYAMAAAGGRLDPRVESSLETSHALVDETK